jgi:hypothetical protein
MPTPVRLYDEDFVAWAERQAAALRSAARAGSNLPLDWENLAEEVDSLGRSQRLALRSQIRRIIHHLLKLAHSPAAGPRNKWRRTVRHARAKARDLLRDSPSLKAEAGRLIAEQTPEAVKLAADDLKDHGELDEAVLAKLQATHHTEDQILGDWMPDEPVKP